MSVILPAQIGFDLAAIVIRDRRSRFSVLRARFVFTFGSTFQVLFRMARKANQPNLNTNGEPRTQKRERPFYNQFTSPEVTRIVADVVRTRSAPVSSTSSATFELRACGLESDPPPQCGRRALSPGSNHVRRAAV